MFWLIIKKIYIILLFSLIVAEHYNNTSINAIIGNRSYLAKYGFFPIDSSSEKDRITVHLEFVIDSLESVPTHSLSLIKTSNRLKHISTLKDYIKDSKFPINTHFQHRTPIFVDNHNTHCAVARILYNDDQLGLIDIISKNDNYSYISEMDNNALIDWVNESGLSLGELSLIQPSYKHMPTRVKKRPILKSIINPIFIIDSTIYRKIGLLSRGLALPHYYNGILYKNIEMYQISISRKGDVRDSRNLKMPFDLKLNEIIIDAIKESKWEPGLNLRNQPIATTKNMSFDLCITSPQVNRYLMQKHRFSELDTSSCIYNPKVTNPIYHLRMNIY